MRGSAGVEFGHAPAVLSFWRRWVGEALRREPTPFFLFSVEPFERAVLRLQGLRVGVPVRQWLSLKTQPFRPLLRHWRQSSGSVEVVSAFEYQAAIEEHFHPGAILLNGPAKHNWLPRLATAGLRVHFDSPAEASALLPWARRLGWRVGLRILTEAEHDYEAKDAPTQFGFEPDEAVRWLRRMVRAGPQLKLESVHFHLRTNLASAALVTSAARQVREICAAAGYRPRYLDVGGGIPPAHTLARSGQRLGSAFSLHALEKGLQREVMRLEGLEELWLENGRYVSAGSGVLVLRVLDIKQRRGWRQLICDGGRTCHALVSQWERHRLLVMPARRGRLVRTAVYGPTCMSFDQLDRGWMPATIRVGDVLVWMEAGAYHLPWETRFSHGLAAILWQAKGRLRRVRRAERFGSWWVDDSSRVRAAHAGDVSAINPIAKR